MKVKQSHKWNKMKSIQVHEGISSVATLIADHNLNILHYDDCMNRLYNIGQTYKAPTLNDAINERQKNGWRSLVEVFENEKKEIARIQEIKSNTSHTTLQFSENGKVNVVSHVNDPYRDRLYVTTIRTGVITPQPPTGESTFKALQWLNQLIAHHPSLISIVKELGSVAQDKRSKLTFFADMTGDIIFSSEIEDPINLGLAVKNIKEYDVDFDQMVRSLKATKRFHEIIQGETITAKFLGARLIELYPGGPSFIYGSFDNLENVVSIETVKSVYPRFTEQEAVAIASLIPGRTLKQAAFHLGKSPVTVALQCRSALYKTPHSTMEELKARLLMNSIGKIGY